MPTQLLRSTETSQRLEMLLLYRGHWIQVQGRPGGPYVAYETESDEYVSVQIAMGATCQEAVERAQAAIHRIHGYST